MILNRFESEDVKESVKTGRWNNIQKLQSFKTFELSHFRLERTILIFDNFKTWSNKVILTFATIQDYFTQFWRYLAELYITILRFIQTLKFILGSHRCWWRMLEMKYVGDKRCLQQRNSVTNITVISDLP